MSRARIIERISTAGLAVPEESVIQHLDDYLLLLGRWNRRINLTALPVDPPTDAAIDRLVVEPLCAADFIDPGALEWIDLGSGNGSPAIPIKLNRPEARLTMVESRGKKASFLREAIRVLDLARSEVFEGRIAEIAESKSHGTAQLVTLRGVRLDNELLEQAARLLAVNGRLFAFGADPTTLQAHRAFGQPTDKGPFVILRKQ